MGRVTNWGVTGAIYVLASGLSGSAEAVADPRFGENELGLVGRRFQFLPELFDEDTQIFDLVSIVGSPDRLEQLAVGDGLVGMSEKVAEQIEFLGSETDRLAFDGKTAG